MFAYNTTPERIVVISATNLVESECIYLNLAFQTITRVISFLVGC